jgi:hypothetical protein
MPSLAAEWTRKRADLLAFPELGAAPIHASVQRKRGPLYG